MKKRSMFFVTIVLTLTLFVSGCERPERKQELQPLEKRLSIVCTVFAVSDWVTQVIGDTTGRFEVTLLAGGGDTHSYQPSAEEITKIHTADLVVFVGGESDKWVEEIVEKESINNLKLFDVLADDLKNTEYVGGISDEKKEENNHTEHEYDEHIWLSLKLAKKSVAAICEEICKIDSVNEEAYRANTADYQQDLSVLNMDYEITLGRVKDATVIFADRFPFGYMMDEYGIKCYSAFSGCNSDTEASFEVVAALAKKVDELNKKSIIVLETSDKKLAKTVIENTKSKDADILVMDSFQSISGRNLDGKVDYLTSMSINLMVLEKAIK